MLDINWPRDVQIIWTKFQGFKTEYYSKKLTPLSAQERIVCADLLGLSEILKIYLLGPDI